VTIGGRDSTSLVFDYNSTSFNELLQTERSGGGEGVENVILNLKRREIFLVVKISFASYVLNPNRPPSPD